MQKVIFFCLFVSSAITPSIALAHGGVNDDELIIRMTKNGFEPSELTVVQGDTVLFINNDEVDRWPASNFHPTHTLYSEFDPEKHIKPGESWQFTFAKPGTWRMHDHLIPHFTGTIVVLEETTKDTPTTSAIPAETPQGLSLWERIKAFFAKLFDKKGVSVDTELLFKFKNLSEREKYAWLEKIAEKESPETAWQYVVDAYDTPQGVVGNPHDMAHLVGQLLFKARGFKGLSTCQPIFAFGCYHGLMEVAFDKNRPEEFQKRLVEAGQGCKNVATTTSPSYWSCIHGIGHGVTTFREFDINKALADCSTFDKQITTYCYDGIFMEFSSSAPANFYTKVSPLYPCDAIGEEYRTACARSQVQVMKFRFDMQNADIADACLKSRSEPIAYHCVDAIGYAVGQGASGDADKVVTGCGVIGDTAARAQCLAAAAGELVFQNMVGWQESTTKICAKLQDTYQIACKERVANVKETYGRN